MYGMHVSKQCKYIDVYRTLQEFEITEYSRVHEQSVFVASNTLFIGKWIPRVRTEMHLTFEFCTVGMHCITSTGNA